MKAMKSGVKETPAQAHENTEMDFDLENNRSSIMVGVVGQKQPGGDNLLDDDLLNEVDLDDVLDDVKKEEFKGMQETDSSGRTKRKLTIQEEQELRGTVMVRAKKE